MDTITQVFQWIVLTIGVGVCLVIASCFVGLALMIVRAAWRVAGDDSDLAPEKKPYTKLRRDS